MRPSRLLYGAAVAFGILALAAPAPADWSDNFNGGTQQTWSAGGLNASLQPIAISAGSVGNVFQLTSPPVTSGGAVIGFAVVNDPLHNVRISGTVNPNGDPGMNGDMGFVARANLATLATYVLTVDPSTPAVYLTRSDPGGAQTILDQKPLPGVLANDSLYLEFDLRDSLLVGRVYDQAGGTLIQTVQAIDTHYTTGVAGLLVNIDSPTAPLLGRFDDVAATTIPEPATVVLAGIGGLACAGWAARRRLRKG